MLSIMKVQKENPRTMWGLLRLRSSSQMSYLLSPNVINGHKRVSRLTYAYAQPPSFELDIDPWPETARHQVVVDVQQAI
jgi:hypothetical protein